MKFVELVYKYKWDEICSVLISLYTNDQKNISGFKMVFERLQTLMPAETNMRIILKEVFDEFENELLWVYTRSYQKNNRYD